MTRDELHETIWNDLSARKHLVGRRRVGRIVDRSLKQFPVAVMAQCDRGEAEVVGSYMARSITKQEVGMGFFAAMVLGTIVSEIIKLLIAKWWKNREELTELCR